MISQVVPAEMNFLENTAAGIEDTTRKAPPATQ
jgi:hypothetical protein